MRPSLATPTALVALALALPAHAQIRASEVASVMQTIDGTTITVQFSRPRVRGRTPTFGSRLAHWGETWTPGANFATTFDVDRPVTLDGHAVPKGKYSVWMVLRQDGDWTLVLDPRAHIFHMDPPDSTAQQIRFGVRAVPGPFTETLTWSFPEYTASGATLAFQWATTRVAMQVGVAPSLRVELPAAEAAPYVGRWAYEEPNDKGPPKKSTFTVFHDGGVMKARWEPNDAYMDTFALIRLAPDTFAPGLYDKDGRIYEVLRPDMTFTFSRANGAVASLEVRYGDDSLGGRATRIP